MDVDENEKDALCPERLRGRHSLKVEIAQTAVVASAFHATRLKNVSQIRRDMDR
jgi:hypothetical protein